MDFLIGYTKITDSTQGHGYKDYRDVKFYVQMIQRTRKRTKKILRLGKRALEF